MKRSWPFLQNSNSPCKTVNVIRHEIARCRNNRGVLTKKCKGYKSPSRNNLDTTAKMNRQMMFSSLFLNYVSRPKFDSRNNLMNRFITESHCFDKYIKSSIFFVNVIVCSDIVAISDWPSRYKKWQRILATRFASLSMKNHRISQTKLLFSSNVS